jgi:hypothetical protein
MVITDRIQPLEDGDNTLIIDGYDNISLHAGHLTVPELKLKQVGSA